MSTPTPKSGAIKAAAAKKTASTGEKTIIFFDWDDTLQASSVLVTNGISLQTPRMPREIETLFAPLQDQVIKLIELAFTHTKNVFVITNAEHGWVELASQKFMPKVSKYIANKLPIVSARTTYQDIFPNQPNSWKRAAFSERINAMFSGQAGSETPPNPFHYVGFPDINIISFGDSECERTALLSLTKSCHATAKIKSIKFVERPSVEQLKRQLQMVESNFPFIIKHDGSLDLMLQISTVQVESNLVNAPAAPPADLNGGVGDKGSSDNAGILSINHGFNNPYLDGNGKPINAANANAAKSAAANGAANAPVVGAKTGAGAGAGGGAGAAKAPAAQPKSAGRKDKKK